MVTSLHFTSPPRYITSAALDAQYPQLQDCFYHCACRRGTRGVNCGRHATTVRLSSCPRSETASRPVEPPVGSQKGSQTPFSPVDKQVYQQAHNAAVVLPDPLSSAIERAERFVGEWQILQTDIRTNRLHVIPPIAGYPLAGWPEVAVSSCYLHLDRW